jgi:hypothetical protein
MYQKKSGIVWRRLEKMRGNRLRSSRKWAGIEIGSVALVGGAGVEKMGANGRRIQHKVTHQHQEGMGLERDRLSRP